jgi:hypothetical protein
MKILILLTLIIALVTGFHADEDKMLWQSDCIRTKISNQQIVLSSDWLIGNKDNPIDSFCYRFTNTFENA